jgi:hypothetical protein
MQGWPEWHQLLAIKSLEINILHICCGVAFSASRTMLPAVWSGSSDPDCILRPCRIIHGMCHPSRFACVFRRFQAGVECQFNGRSSTRETVTATGSAIMVRFFPMKGMGCGAGSLRLFRPCESHSQSGCPCLVACGHNRRILPPQRAFFKASASLSPAA